MNQETINNFPMTHKPGTPNAMNLESWYKLVYNKPGSIITTLAGEVFSSLWDALEQTPNKNTMDKHGSQVYIWLFPKKTAVYFWDIQNEQWNKIEDIHV